MTISINTKIKTDGIETALNVLKKRLAIIENLEATRLEIENNLKSSVPGVEITASVKTSYFRGHEMMATRFEVSKAHEAQVISATVRGDKILKMGFMFDFHNGLAYTKSI
jgi:hypothetical protein